MRKLKRKVSPFLRLLSDSPASLLIISGPVEKNKKDILVSHTNFRLPIIVLVTVCPFTITISSKEINL